MTVGAIDEIRHQTVTRNLTTARIKNIGIIVVLPMMMIKVIVAVVGIIILGVTVGTTVGVGSDRPQQSIEHLQ